ncbi:MAG TPA: Uma2 family endonuclease [Chthoniobacterales bacterium]
MLTTGLLRSWQDQAAINRRVWSGLLADSSYAECPERVETDREGRAVASPPPSHRHSRRQFRIGNLLEALMPNGFVLTECAVSTLHGVKAADVAWYNPSRAAEADAAELPDGAPDICVEVVSPSNATEQLEAKAAAYFAAGAKEVWVCGLNGRMSFFRPDGPIERSQLCPDFPLTPISDR